MTKSGGQLFATEGLRGLKALLLQGGRAWLLQNLQLSQRKALCNLHQEVCAEGRGRGQEEAAALRRGQSKLLSRKKKKAKQNTRHQSAHPSSRSLPAPALPRPPLGPCTLAACLLGAESAGQSRVPRDAQPMRPLDPPRPVRALCVKLPCLLVGGGTLTYICPMGDGAGGGTVTQFEPMR